MTQQTLEWLEANDYRSDTLDLQGSYGNTALMKAAREGNAAIVDELLQAGADPVLKNVDGNQALWLACFGENPEVVRLLITAGCDVDNANVNGVTPLMYTASSGKEQMVEMLLDAGADPSLKNPDDFTAFDLSATLKIFRLLKQAMA
jgi:ankyrin repeat protein